MSWFWSSSGTRSDGSSKRETKEVDVYADLSPELQAFVSGSTENSPRSSETIDNSRTKILEQRNALAPQPELKDSLSDAVAQGKTRKSQINAGAMFNCALAEYELNECFNTGSWWDKSKLCEMQKGAFWKCLESNRKALTVLGYGEPGNSAAQNEILLGAADDLVGKSISI